jgi:hypothetical protein
MLIPLQWIPVHLTPLFGLDDSELEKASLFIEDLCIVLNVYWVRNTTVFAHKRFWVQMVPLLIIAGCTATRPGAIVGTKPLLYKDIEFQVFPPSHKGQLARVILTLILKHNKRSSGKSRRLVVISTLNILYIYCSRKKFMFYNNNGNLMCNPIMYIMALAFADNAFQNNFTCPEEIYSLVVPPKSDRIRLR